MRNQRSEAPLFPKISNPEKPFDRNGVCLSQRIRITEAPLIHTFAEVNPSKIAGHGIFATSSIQEGEIVLVCGGQLFSKRDVLKGKARRESLTGFDEGIYIGTPIDSPAGADEFFNHSCDSNLWLIDQITLVASRPINPGEELTVDYAIWEIDEHWMLPNRCNCGSKICRKIITGKDWRLDSLRNKYRNHFLPCINRRSLEERN